MTWKVGKPILLSISTLPFNTFSAIWLTHNREQKCNGFSRNKVDNGNWVAESTNYINDVQATGNVCRPEQATPVYPNGTPMTTARPGDTLLIRFWGNGHSRADIGSPKGRDPAFVRLFWAGRKETEITKKEDLEKFFIPGTQQGFASNAVILLENGDTTMNEKGNYMTFKVPDQIENGRHMMVWSWAWAKSLVPNPPDFKPGDFDRTWAEEFTTCFDINIVDSKFTGMLVPFNPLAYSSTSTGVNPAQAARIAAFESGAVSNPADDVCSKTCVIAGFSGECTGEKCPPCRFKNGSKVDCYDYNSGSCPAFGAGFDCGKKKPLKRRDSARISAKQSISGRSETRIGPSRL